MRCPVPLITAARPSRREAPPGRRRAGRLALALAALAACGDATPGLSDGEICERASTPEVAHLCAVDRAAALAAARDLSGARAVCAAVEPGTWRAECGFQISEALARDGQLDAALAACADAGGFTSLCLGHAAWIRSEDLVDARPDDAAAQAAVDAFIAGLPGGAAATGQVESIARAAAWHGIYAGAGSADPTAARGARPEDAPYARAGLAWEAARLLEAPRSAAALVEALPAIWRGERPAPSGAALQQACWPVRLMPRLGLKARGREPTARTYPGGIRSVDPDPDTDLIIAAVEAAFAHGMDADEATLRALLAGDSPAGRVTASRHIGLLVERYPDLREALPDRRLRRAAAATRDAVTSGRYPRPVVSPEEC